MRSPGSEVQPEAMHVESEVKALVMVTSAREVKQSITFFKGMFIKKPLNEGLLDTGLRRFASNASRTAAGTVAM